MLKIRKFITFFLPCSTVFLLLGALSAQPTPFQDLDGIPSILEKGPLSFPSDLKRNANAGYAKIWVTINEDGSTGRMSVVEANHPFFAEEAIETLLQTTFEKPTQGGNPVSTQFLVGFRFPRDPRMQEKTDYDVFLGNEIPERIIYSTGLAVPQVEISAMPNRGEGSSTLPEAAKNRLPPPNPFFDFPEKVTEGPLQYDEVPRVIKFYPPIYPTSRVLSGKGMEKVQVSWLIAPNGVPFQPTVAPGVDPDYAKATEAAIRYWRFLPGQLNGEPVLTGLASPYEFSRFRMVDSELKSAAKQIRSGKIKPVSPSELDNSLSLLVHETIRYPLTEENASGYAVIKAYINPDGRVILPEIEETNNEDLAWAALTGFSHWRFTKPTHNGEPVHVVIKQRFEN